MKIKGVFLYARAAPAFYPSFCLGSTCWLWVVWPENAGCSQGGSLLEITSWRHEANSYGDAFSSRKTGRSTNSRNLTWLIPWKWMVGILYRFLLGVSLFSGCVCCQFHRGYLSRARVTTPRLHVKIPRNFGQQPTSNTNRSGTADGILSLCRYQQLIEQQLESGVVMSHTLPQMLLTVIISEVNLLDLQNLHIKDTCNRWALSDKWVHATKNQLCGSVTPKSNN